MVLEPRWLKNNEYEFHHLYLFDKNEVQGSVSLCKF